VFQNALLKLLLLTNDISEEQKPFIEINKRLSYVGWPVITKRKEALPSADEFKDIKSKRHLLEE